MIRYEYTYEEPTLSDLNAGDTALINYCDEEVLVFIYKDTNHKRIAVTLDGSNRYWEDVANIDLPVIKVLKNPRIIEED